MIKYLTEEFNIKVLIEDVSDMTGIVVDINFDPTIMEPVKVETRLDVINYDFLPGATLITTNELQGIVNAKLNIPISPASGKGELFSIKFRAIGIGTTDITLTNCALYDISGEIPANWENGIVNIIQMATIRVI